MKEFYRFVNQLLIALFLIVALVILFGGTLLVKVLQP